jgi:hypothetical protein
VTRWTDAATLVLALACCALLGCSAYEPRLLPPASQPDAGPAVEGDGGADSGASSDSGAEEDAAVRPGCRPNPLASDPLCPEICSESCNGLDDDCDGRADEDTSAVCAADHATVACVQGTCVVVECQAPFRDCDARADNGCEVSIADDPAHCGGCGNACAVERAAAMACSEGVTCVATECTEGYGDCDGQAENGCETFVRTPEHCGGCAGSDAAQACEGLANVAASDCGAGTCRVVECEPGFLDCDREVDNGCELAETAGACDCDMVTDGDGDGVVHCLDACDDDPDKTAAGMCGCGAGEADSDGDGTADCVDLCDADSDKQDPGVCGCGAAETDRDADGTLDCADGCPRDPTVQGACFPFAANNFDPTQLDFSAQPSSTLSCGTTTIDTNDPDGSGPLVATISNWCGTAPSPIARTQSGGPDIVIVPLRGLTVASGATLRLVGSRPVLFAVRGDVGISGTINASANGTTPGAGGNWSCTPATASGAGANGSGSTVRWPTDGAGASGGGGGGFGTVGGRGGTADTDNNGSSSGGSGTPGGNGGATRGTAGLIPLVGGCPGGRAGGCSSDGGAGGGAVQISASGSLVFSGTITANGGSGATPCGASDEGGGTGGGSGGGIFLEASTVDLRPATFTANGGRGGANGSYDGVYDCGGTSGGNGSSSPSSAGSNGGSCQGGSPGGGGGYGRRRVSAAVTCDGCQ